MVAVVAEPTVFCDTRDVGRLTTLSVIEDDVQACHVRNRLTVVVGVTDGHRCRHHLAWPVTVILVDIVVPDIQIRCGGCRHIDGDVVGIRVWLRCRFLIVTVVSTIPTGGTRIRELGLAAFRHRLRTVGIHTVVANLPWSVEHPYTQVALSAACRRQTAVRHHLFLTRHTLAVGAVQDTCKRSTATDAYQRVAVFLRRWSGVTALEGIASVFACTALEAILSFAQGRYCRTNLVQSYDVLRQVAAQRRCHIPLRLVVAEVGCCHRTLQVFTEIGTSRIRERSVRSFVNLLASLKLHLAAIIQTGDASEGEHQRQVLGPLCRSAVEAVLVAVVLRTVVV